MLLPLIFSTALGFLSPGSDSTYLLVGPMDYSDSVACADTVRAIREIPIDTFAPHSFSGSNGIDIRYRLLSPEQVAPDSLYPLVVVFHGAGEMGTDNSGQMDQFPKMWARSSIRARYPSFVLVPQVPARSAIYSGPRTDPGRTSSPGAPLYAEMELIAQLCKELPVDTNRVYAIGFSMGGSTVWNALSLRPGFFAAAIPIAGVPNPQTFAGVVKTPVWIVHGNQDRENSIARDRAMYEKMRARDSSSVRFWEFDDMGHQVPLRLLAGEECAQWLFAHHGARQTKHNIR